MSEAKLSHGVINLIAFGMALIAASYTAPTTANAGGDGYMYGTSWGTQGNNKGELNTPKGIAIGPDGSVYVADSGNDRIQKFSPLGEYIAYWGENGNANGKFDNPTDVAVSQTGDVFVADFGNNRVQRFNSRGNYETKWGQLGIGDGQFNGPRGIEIDDDRKRVYVADALNNRIQKFTTDGVFVSKWGTIGVASGEFLLPADAAVDKDGDVYVADYQNHRIQKFDLNGNFLTRFGFFGHTDRDFDLPMSVALDSQDRILIADTYNNRINRYLTDHVFLDSFGTIGHGVGELFYPESIAIDSKDNVYVADTLNHRIQVFFHYRLVTDGGELHVGERDSQIWPKDPENNYDFQIPTSEDDNDTLIGPKEPEDTQSAPSPSPDPGPTQQPGNSNSPLQPPSNQGLQDTGPYGDACTLKVTSPKTMRKGKRSKTLRVSRKNTRRLFTHGAKGYIKWGKVAGRDVVCKKVKMLLLQKRGRRYYVPGTKIAVSKKNLSVDRLSKTAAKLRKKGVGKLRQKSLDEKRVTKLSYKAFNRTSRHGRRALNRLQSRRYRGAYIFIYTAEVDGRVVRGEVRLTAR